jgi:hypothetical protein
MVSENINILALEDIILIPIYLIIIYILIKKFVKQEELALFIKGWKIKVLFTLVNLCIFQFYYNGKTDGTSYQYAVDVLRENTFNGNIGNVIEFVFTTPENYSKQTEVLFGNVIGALATNKLVSIGYLITCMLICKNYAITSLFFSLIAYIGAWLIYKVFIDVYPSYKKQLQYTILLIPSVCFWASCFMKDPLTFAGLGFVFYGLYYLLIKLKFKITTLLLLLIGIYFLTIKIYILACIAPLFGMWLFIVYKKRIRTPFLKFITISTIGAVGYFGVGFVLDKIGSFDSRYDIENLTATIEGMSEYLSRADASESSTYDIGLTNLTSPSAAIAIFPKAVNVALFRPYLWESRKPIYIPAGLEAFISLLFILFILFKVGPFQIIKTLYHHPLLLMSILFTIAFAFMTGATSGNFGTLVRYKIPCLPFFYSALLIIYLEFKSQKLKNEKLDFIDK